MDSASPPVKRTRKSAPVKNAIFLGAVHKDRSRINVLRESNTENPSHTKNRRSRYSEFSIENRDPQCKSVPRQIFTPKSSIRMSTPVRRGETPPRYRTRNRSRQQNVSDHDRSRSIVSSIGSRRRYHPDYDPLIEIRRAKERLERFKAKDDWKADMLLSDDCDEDLRRYEEKLQRRLSERGDSSDPIQLERRPMELLRRQKDIDLGKVTDRYAEYVLSVPKPERERYMPRTPNKFRKVSRRAWDGMIRKWRKHLHSFDDLKFEESWRSLSSTYVSTGSGLSTPNHSIESVNFSDHEDDRDVKDAKLTASATVRISVAPEDCRPEATKCTNERVVHERPPNPEEEEEETLQANSKCFRGHSPIHRIKRDGEDEDTLSAIPAVAGRRVTRSLKRLSGPTPDILHSGLTNDMAELSHAGKKRLCAHLTSNRKGSNRSTVVDISSLNEFPKLGSDSVTVLPSPSKRAHRGILSENGLQWSGD